MDGKIPSQVPVGRLVWFTDLRWWAVGVGLVVVTAAPAVFPVRFDVPKLAGGLAVLALLNACYRIAWREMKKRETDPDALARKARVLIHVQMLGDLAFLTVLLAESGGVENPFFLLYLFHLAIASIALPWMESGGYAALVTLMPWLLWAMKSEGWIQPLWGNPPLGEAWQAPALLAVYSAVAWGIWFFLTSLTGDLLDKERELAKTGERLKAANEDLKKLDAEKNQFFRQIAHELKNPLAASSACLEAAEATLPRGRAYRARDMMTRAKVRLGSLGELMDDLIWLSQSKSADPPYHRERLDPVPIVQRCLQDIEAKAQGRGLVVRWEGLGPDRGILADARAFRRVLDNLLENAVKYTPPGRGDIRVLLDEEEGFLRVSVEDPGIGVPAGEQGGLFHEFVRGTNARISGEPGTGLGLVIVKRIMDWHGGRVEMQSRHGEGTRVDTWWPLAPPKK